MGADLFNRFNDLFGGTTGLQGLKKDIANEASKSNVQEYKEVPQGKYEVKIEKLELGATGANSKTPNMPMLKVWYKIIAGEYKGQLIFQNQMLTQSFGFVIANQLLESLETSHDIAFEEFVQYGQLIEDVFNEIDGVGEYELDYGKNKKGYNTYKILQRYDTQIPY